MFGYALCKHEKNRCKVASKQKKELITFFCGRYPFVDHASSSTRMESAIAKHVYLQIVCPDDHYYNASLDACSPGNLPTCEKGPSNWYRGDSSENHGNCVVNVCNQCRIQSCPHNFRSCRRFRMKTPFSILILGCLCNHTKEGTKRKWKSRL